MMEKSSVPYDTISVNSSREPLFNRCFCCFPLRIGCFILGYISLFVNAIRTLFFVAVTLYYSLKTHGFDHMDPASPDMDDDEPSNIALDSKLAAMDQETMQIVGWTLIIMTIFDLIWLVINIACLVGIHKKRPGPIRAYVGFATVRLILTMAGYMYQLNASDSGNPHIIAHCIDLGLTAYFILVYYIYAMKLEKEAHEVPQVQVNDIAYIYPTKLDKEHLVV